MIIGKFYFARRKTPQRLQSGYFSQNRLMHINMPLERNQLLRFGKGCAGLSRISLSILPSSSSIGQMNCLDLSGGDSGSRGCGSNGHGRFGRSNKCQVSPCDPASSNFSSTVLA